MLSAADNELISHVGPGTPMGNLMRQYWLPAYSSDEVAPDGPPLRVRLLGENLVGFRTTSGKVGLLGDVCPHRCTSLFFGRNEEDGLRCIYHGWKFDVTGACVDQPGEPEDMRFESRVSAQAYPCIERNGVIWTYMGPRPTPPPLPDVEPNMLGEPSTNRRTLRYCNWLQALEGDIDTVHSEYLHADARIDVAAMTPGTGPYYRHRLRKPLHLVAKDTEFGASYGAYRPAEADTTYWRIAHFLFPCVTMTPTPAAGSSMSVRFWVPVDDEHVLFWTINPPSTRQRPAPSSTNPGGAARPQGSGDAIPRLTQGSGDGGGFKYLPNTDDSLGRYRPVQRAENDYLLDRVNQRDVDFTGISGGAVMEDTAVTEAMGPILDRTQEHLGHSDTMIARTRQRLLAAVRALADQGTAPPGVDNPDVYRTRSGWLILPNETDWWEGSKELRAAFAEIRDETAALAALRS